MRPNCVGCILQRNSKQTLAITESRLQPYHPEGAELPKLCIAFEGASTKALETGELVDFKSNIIWQAFVHIHQQLYKDRPLPALYFVSAHLCKFPTKATPAEIVSSNCIKEFHAAIKQSNCTTVLAVGGYTGMALVGDVKFSISNMQGRPLNVPELGVVVVPCYSPMLLNAHPTEYYNFIDAIEKAVHAANGENILPNYKETKWKLLDSPIKVDEFIKKSRDTGHRIFACDIETSDLSFVDSRILCLGISNEPGTAVVVPETMFGSPEELSAVSRLLNQPDFTYIWHNGKFDINFLNTHGCRDVRIDEDTLLLHYALNENTGTHGLELLSGRLLGADNYKKQLKSNLEDPGDSYAKLPLETLYQYQAQDADNTLQIFNILKPQVEADPKLIWLYQNILIPAQNFLHQVEIVGIYTHENLLKKVDVELQAQIAQVKQEISEESKSFWNTEKYAQDMQVVKVPKEFNPASPKQVAWVLYKQLKCVPTVIGAKKHSETSTLPDTAEKTLLSIEPKPRFVQLLLTLRELIKLHSTYVVNLLEKRDALGRIHTTYSLYGTTTGRLASKKPNIQNIPRDKRIKTLFGAPPERLLLECDYKSAELRALAMYSKDPFLIRVFSGNFDMHDETAAAMFGPNFTSEQRMQAKMINFGIMYGRGPKTISEDCKISMQEAQDAINKWLARMPLAAMYLRAQRAAIKSGCVLVTPFGRKRRFPFVVPQRLNTYQNEACNFAIQSVASDFTLLTAIRIQPQLKKLGAFVVNLVHDSIMIELPKNREIAKFLMEYVPEQMSQTPAQWFKLPFKFCADASIGTHWGRLTDDLDKVFEQN